MKALIKENDISYILQSIMQRKHPLSGFHWIADHVNGQAVCIGNLQELSDLKNGLYYIFNAEYVPLSPETEMKIKRQASNYLVHHNDEALKNLVTIVGEERTYVDKNIPGERIIIIDGKVYPESQHVREWPQLMGYLESMKNQKENLVKLKNLYEKYPLYQDKLKKLTSEDQIVALRRAIVLEEWIQLTRDYETLSKTIDTIKKELPHDKLALTAGASGLYHSVNNYQHVVNNPRVMYLLNEVQHKEQLLKNAETKLHVVEKIRDEVLQNPDFAELCEWASTTDLFGQKHSHKNLTLLNASELLIARYWITHVGSPQQQFRQSVGF